MLLMQETDMHTTTSLLKCQNFPGEYPWRSENEGEINYVKKKKNRGQALKAVEAACAKAPR